MRGKTPEQRPCLPSETFFIVNQVSSGHTGQFPHAEFIYGHKICFYKFVGVPVFARILIDNSRQLENIFYGYLEPLARILVMLKAYL